MKEEVPTLKAMNSSALPPLAELNTQGTKLNTKRILQETSLATQGKHSKAQPQKLSKVDYTIVTTEQFTKVHRKGLLIYIFHSHGGT